MFVLEISLTTLTSAVVSFGPNPIIIVTLACLRR
jgi:hypothetical protein